MPDDQDNLSERLNDLSRIDNQSEAWMPEKYEPLAEDARAEILAWLKAFQADNKLTDARVARMIGSSASVVHEVKAGKYKGNVDAVLRKISKLKLRPVPKPKTVQDAFVTISVVNDMYGTISMVIDACMEDEPVMGAIVGPAGSGKSMGLRGIGLKHAESVYMEITEAHSQHRTFLKKLSDELKVRGPKRQGIGDLFDSVCTKLAGSYRLLIFDEVHLATQRVQNTIRQIMDRTGVPIILAGQPELETMIKKGRFDQSRGATVSSRIGPMLNLMDIVTPYEFTDPTTGRRRKKTDRQLLHTPEDVKKLLESRNLRIHPEAMRILLSLANDFENGGLRVMTRIAYQCKRTWPDKKAIDADQLQQIMRRWFSHDVLAIENEWDRSELSAKVRRVMEKTA
jgi:DNA transposition AAA+ family ATPase